MRLECIYRDRTHAAVKVAAVVDHIEVEMWIPRSVITVSDNIDAMEEDEEIVIEVEDWWAERREPV